MDPIRQMKIATGTIFNLENHIALDIDRTNQYVNFAQANLFQDFKEFLMDEYMEPGEFDDMWEQFEQWLDPPKTTTL